MENQERHNKKIDLLSKCIDAKVITLQDALMLLDADIVPEAEPSKDPGHSTWQPPTYYPTILPFSQPLSGTIQGSSSVLTTASTSGSNTTTTYPAGASITYTNTVGSITEALSKQIQ